jgi:hypothetical protein
LLPNGIQPEMAIWHQRISQLAAENESGGDAQPQKTMNGKRRSAIEAKVTVAPTALANVSPSPIVSQLNIPTLPKNGIQQKTAT